MSFEAAKSLRPVWEADVLDLLTVRGAVRFSEWTPRTIPAITRSLSGEDWQAVIAAQTLASDALSKDLGRASSLAARELEQGRERVVRSTRGRLHGKPDHRATRRIRIARQDDTLWVTRNHVKRWQTDDNAALVGWLTYLRTVASNLRGKQRQSQGWRSRVAVTEVEIERLLRTEPLRHVTGNPLWAGYDIPDHVLSRSQFYRDIWKYARAWRTASYTKSPAAIRKVLQGGWLAAENDDQLYELYVMSRLVEVLHRLGPWDSFVLRPSVVEASVILEAVQSDGSVTARFDRTPPAASAYAWLFKRYEGIDPRARRPDIHLSVSPSGKPARETIVEVKATAPSTGYGRDSIYKLLGYLADYAALWSHETTVTYPRGLLVFATGATSSVGRTVRLSNDEVVLTNHALLMDDLEGLVVKLLTD